MLIIMIKEIMKYINNLLPIVKILEAEGVASMIHEFLNGNLTIYSRKSTSVT